MNTEEDLMLALGAWLEHQPGVTLVVARLSDAASDLHVEFVLRGVPLVLSLGEL